MEDKNRTERRRVAQANCLKVKEYDTEDLARLDLGTTFNFVDQQPLLDQFIKLFTDVKRSDFKVMPMQVIESIIKHSEVLFEYLQKILKFKVEGVNHPSDARNMIVRDLESSFYEAYKELSMVPIFFSQNSKKLDEASSLLQKTNNLVVDTTKLVEAKAQEMEQLLNSAQQTLGKIGVASHAVHFQEAAEEYKTASKHWLSAVIVVICLIVGWGTFCFFIHPKGSDTNLILQYTISKLIIISGLYFALNTTVRNYKANRHNYIVNRHKQHSLSSFESFVKGAGDDMATKNAILLNATQSIFSTQPSGYTNVEPDNETNKVIEILQSPLSK